MMNLQQIPRTMVESGLDIARVPIDVVARLTGGDERWAIAVDRLESGVRETAGRLLRDDTLVGDARLQRAEADQREKAFRKRLEAERDEREGRQRAKAVEQRADAAERAERERGEERDAAIDREARRVERAAVQKRAAALTAKEHALQTKATAQRLDAAAEATKARRKSSRS